MTTYAYVRISSLKQEAGFGKEVQRNAIEALATANALAPFEWCEETESGENFADRPVFQRLRTITKAGDNLIVYKLDRFSRNMIDTELMLGEFVEKGVRVHSTISAEQGWLDPERFYDPANKLMRQIMAAFNEYDKATLLGRMQSGLKAKAAKGGFAGGVPPFGYKIENLELVIDPDKIEAVIAVLSMEAMGLSLREISRRMAANFDHVIAYSKDKDSAKTMGWDVKTIQRIIDRRMLYTQGRYRDRNSEVDHQRDDLIICRV